MNEIAVVASETHEKAIAYFKVAEQYGYKFIMEVKKIRDDRLYKEIGFSSFDAYCESAWKTKRDSMDERIKIAVEFGEDFDGTYRHLGHSKSLMLARMEPEVRQKIESTVKVDETTVKQLNQIEKQLKETERDRVKLENESIYYQKLLNQERSKPSQVVTKEVKVEVEPSDYKQIKNELRDMNAMKIQLNIYKQKAELNEQEAKEYAELKKKINFLHEEKNDLHRQIESATALSGLSVKIDNFLKTELAPMRYSRALERLDSEVAVRNLTDIIHSVENWVIDMRRYLPQENRIIVEVMDYDNVS